MFAIHDKYIQICMVLKKAQHSRNTKFKWKESLGLCGLERYSAISLSSIAPWKRSLLSGHAVQVRIPSIVVCHLWKNQAEEFYLMASQCRKNFGSNL